MWFCLISTRTYFVVFPCFLGCLISTIHGFVCFHDLRFCLVSLVWGFDWFLHVFNWFRFCVFLVWLGLVSVIF